MIKLPFVLSLSAFLLSLVQSVHVVGNGVVISDFTTSSPIEMVTVNDPVMGGESYSTVEQTEDCLVWEGEVKIVSFLQSPGFCILETEEKGDIPTTDLDGTDGISFYVRTDSDFMPMSAVVQTDFKKFGFHVQYSATLKETSRQENIIELHASWDTFSASIFGRNVDAPALVDDLKKIENVVREKTEEMQFLF